jgi:hypothetical protein
LRNPEVHSQLDRALAIARVAGVTLLLGGCAMFHKPPVVVAAAPPQPAPVACVDPAQIPDEPPMVGQRFNGDAKHDLQVLAPNARALREWGQQLRTLLDGCAPKPVETAAVTEPAAKP